MNQSDQSREPELDNNLQRLNNPERYQSPKKIKNKSSIVSIYINQYNLTMSSVGSMSVKRTIVILMVALIVVASLQPEPLVQAGKSDLLFVKGKFIKKDKKGTIVVDDKCSCCHKGHRRR